MTKNIFFLIKKLKNNKKIIFYFLVIFIILSGILLFLSLKISRNFNKENVLYKPLSRITARENFNGDVYFNNKLMDESFLDIIKKEIRIAEKSVEIAMYSFNVLSLKQEIYKANERGVKVVMIFPNKKIEQHNKVFSNLPAKIQRFDVGGKINSKTPQYMHHKFVIIDRGYQNQKLITGSLNWTELQEFYDSNYLFITLNKEIINAYGKEFDRLKTGYGGLWKIKQKDYKPWIKNINFNDCFIDIWFSPGIGDNSINTKIKDLILQAKKDIKIMIWQITDYEIARAIIKKAISGINITIIAGDSNIFEKSSVFPYLLKSKEKYNLKNFNILNDVWRTIDMGNKINKSIVGENFNSFLHHHTLMIDNNLVLFGTNNWSNMGSNINDENVIITNNKKIVDKFLKTFDWHYNELRNNILLAEIKDGNLFIPNIEKYNGKKLIVVSVKNKAIINPDICLQAEIKINDLFVLDSKCKNKYLDIFIYDKLNKVYANNLIFNN